MISIDWQKIITKQKPVDDPDAMTVEQFAGETGLSPRAARIRLKKMEDDGIVVKVKVKNHGGGRAELDAFKLIKKGKK